MPIRSFSELGALFLNQSTGLWERLSYVRESIKRKETFGIPLPVVVQSNVHQRT